MPYRRGFSTLGCPASSIDQVFALARTHALDCVELRALGGSLELATYLEGQFETPAELGALARASGIQINAIDTSFKLMGDVPAGGESLLQLVQWADGAGIPWLRVFDGGVTADDAELARAAEAMAWWHESRSRNGWQVELMVETHDSLLTAAAIRRFIAVVPKAFVLWDAHHTWRKGGESPLETWRAIRDHVAHVHVKDSVSVPSARHPFTYVLPGAGEFPMDSLRPVLAAEYAGVVSFEWEKMWHPTLPSLDQALSVAAQRHWW